MLGGVVRTNDGHEVPLDAELWEASPVLRKHSQNETQPFALGCSEDTLALLLKVHRENIFPRYYRHTYDLLTLVMNLQLEKITRLCLKHLFRSPDFWRYNYPNNIPDEVVLTCFKESLNRLFRKSNIYEHEVSEITKLSRGSNQKTLILNALEEKIKEFAKLVLVPVPVYFRKRSLPIFIISYRGKLETAILHSGDILPYELFGCHFKLSKVDIDAFYLKYASYVLFKSQRRVFWKDLRQPTEACQMKENCSVFISREDTVFIVIEEDSENLICEWIENEENGGSFAVIHRTPDKVLSLDFDPSPLRRLLVLKDSGSLSIAKLEDHKLVSIREIGNGVTSAWFYGTHVVAFRPETENEGKIEMQHIELDEAVEDEKLNHIKRDWFKALARSGSAFSVGGVLFQLSPHAFGWLDPQSNGRLNALLNPEHYLTSSELFLHP